MMALVFRNPLRDLVPTASFFSTAHFLVAITQTAQEERSRTAVSIAALETMCIEPNTKSQDFATVVAINKTTTLSPTLSPTLSAREQKIVKLNERVAAITARYLENHKNEEHPLWIAHVQQKMTHVTAGYPIYVKRNAFLVYFYCVVAVAILAIGVAQQPLWVSAVCLLMSFIGYDIYSGILHVVLDHPDNIKLPVLGQPCLEFQWHHAIPDDIVRKDFVDVCGDLNVVVAILSALNAYLLGFPNMSSVALTFGGLKCLMAYFGQFSHRSAHSVSVGSFRWLASQLQENGFMISVKNHMSHHKEPHDKDFCLVGICNPIIDAMRAVTTNPTAWLILFSAWSIFDIAIYSHVVETLAETVAAL
jgi:palmitoyl-[glycerolipid] 3-(E)-desaturase